MPTGDRDAYVSWGGFSIAPQVAISRWVGPVLIATNLGYAVLPRRTLVSSDSYSLAADDELVFRIGARVHPRDAVWDAGLELNGAFYVAGDSRSELDSLEVIVGGGVTLWNRLRFTLGGGVQALGGYGTPTFRGFFAASYTHGVDRDPAPEPFSAAEALPEVVAPAAPSIDAAGETGTPRVGAGAADPAHAGGHDADRDEDGIRDADDECPSVAEDRDGDRDEDGCPEADDPTLFAPSTPAADARPAATVGAGAFGRAPAADLARIPLSGPVDFRDGSARLTGESRQVLDRVATYLASHPEVLHVTIEAHTDRSGRFRMNLRLSQRRAAAVRRYLVRRGVPEKRLRAVGMGWGRPLVPHDSPGAVDRNRRVELLISR